MNLGNIWMAFLMTVLGNISEPVRKAIRESMIQLDIKAKSTPNPWDNILVVFLATMLGVDLGEKKSE